MARHAYPEVPQDDPYAIQRVRKAEVEPECTPLELPEAADRGRLHANRPWRPRGSKARKD